MHNGWVDVWLSWCNEDHWPLSATAMQFGLCGTGFPNLTGMANLSPGILMILSSACLMCLTTLRATHLLDQCHHSCVIIIGLVIMLA
jgi:hypothetical protein